MKLQHYYDKNKDLITFHTVEGAISFNEMDYETKAGINGDMVNSFREFLEETILTCSENNGTFEDVIFIAEDAYEKL